jgi:peptidoglycan/LPS O-acetylase OafA/YrhL
MRYNPGLDGLRAVAVVFVIACHSMPIFPGWIGVYVFFVLSGYLITSILLVELRETGSISMSNFYCATSLAAPAGAGDLVDRT